ncbi:DUF86 domain-containing protein [Ramlibacter sp. WS9]|uniref:HepT-like ribonuclease domain-containing protein n=1 Tax=Ramlibacter sp. WS9 TaxID=1882741 RepID=UPI001143AA28|nr:HepT-like ribonuclease domain-containing protein [Ramlibacter sp. WS9]ROZ72753.1 DUF86 domain-containing protein [Ramlibacter sp. WS9]
MTGKAPKLLLGAVEAAKTAREFLGDLSIEQYLLDHKTRSAVERQLEILGEACSRLAKLEPALTDQLAGLKLAIGLRNRIIHGYDGVDHEIVHQTVSEDLIPLVDELGRLLDERSGP